MEMVKVLHMNGGNGETSYASNSLVQEKVISLTKPIRQQEIINLCTTTSTRTLCIADLGCSCGPNSLLVASEFMNMAHMTCKKLGKEMPEIQIYLNDLPGNDFNIIFKFLPNFQAEMRTKMGSNSGSGSGSDSCFVTGVPGSFYGRLFPANSVHFVHSSYSLMWLSQVPNGIEENKGNVYMASTSPKHVLESYYEQFQKDFSLFLKCRSEEMVSGGRMVLTLLGRESEDRSSKECCYIWELMAMALNQMVKQGVIEEEKMDSFNIPQYTPSPTEVKLEIEKEGSFSISNLEVSTVNWNASSNGHYLYDRTKLKSIGGYNMAKCMQAVAEPLLVSHFGQDIIDEVFDRYMVILTDRMAREDTRFYNVTVSMTRK